VWDHVCDELCNSSIPNERGGLPDGVSGPLEVMPLAVLAIPHTSQHHGQDHGDCREFARLQKAQTRRLADGILEEQESYGRAPAPEEWIGATTGLRSR